MLSPFAIGLQLPETYSLMTAVLRIMVSEPRPSCLLAFIQRHPFLAGQMPQPGQITTPRTRFGEFLFESLTFQTA